MICDPRDGGSDDGLIKSDQQHGQAKSNNDHQKFDAFGVDYVSIVWFGLPFLDNGGIIIEAIGFLLPGHVVNMEVGKFFLKTNKIYKTIPNRQ
jgi:hypothetical protein